MLDSDREEEAFVPLLQCWNQIAKKCCSIVIVSTGFRERKRGERGVSLFIKSSSLSFLVERTLCLLENIYQRERNRREI